MMVSSAQSSGLNRFAELTTPAAPLGTDPFFGWRVHPSSARRGIFSIMTAMVETLSIAPEFEGAARVGLLEIDGVRVQESPEELKTMLNRLADEFAGKYKD